MSASYREDIQWTEKSDAQEAEPLNSCSLDSVVLTRTDNGFMSDLNKEDVIRQGGIDREN
jgi:hypothetical protein